MIKNFDLVKRGLSSVRTFSTKQGAVDVHTHMYLPKYMDILRKRTDVPYVRNVNDIDRLVILPGEDKNATTAIGRPIGREYFDVSAKLQFMDNHGISTSVISLANPWLDFLSGDAAHSVAQELNDELEGICSQSQGRLYGFATLPVRNAKASLAELERLSGLKHIRGVILGTPGAGNGLDHDDMRDVLASIEEKGLLIFLHPHYGVGNEHFHNSGHTLFLALGFPFETTVCVSRLIVTGALDRLPKLKLLVAHAGAALPALIGRLDSCVEHDHAIADRLIEKPTDYLKRLYFDNIAYSKPALGALMGFVDDNRIMFGTDNPFFPPLHVDDVCNVVWPSTKKVYETMSSLPEPIQKRIIYENAKKLLMLK